MQLKSIPVPDLDGKSVTEQNRAILEYVLEFQKQVNYTLQYLGTDNMAAEVVDKIETASGSKVVRFTDGDLESLFKQTKDAILLMVKKGEVIGAINLSAEEAKIAAGKITLEGIVTANNYFKILADGSMEATGAKISGKFTSLEALFGTTGTYFKIEERTIGGVTYWGIFFSSANDSYIAMDSYGVLHINNYSGGVQFGTGTPVIVDELRYNTLTHL